MGIALGETFSLGYAAGRARSLEQWLHPRNGAGNVETAHIGTQGAGREDESNASSGRLPARQGRAGSSFLPARSQAEAH